MLIASSVHPPRITIHEPQPVVANATASGELPALLQQSLAMWERIFAHQTGTIAPPTLLAPQSPAPTTATTDQSQGACAS